MLKIMLKYSYILVLRLKYVFKEVDIIKDLVTHIELNELKFFLNKKYRDTYLNMILEEKHKVEKELEEAKKVINSYQETNLKLLEEIKRLEKFKINMGKGRSKVDLNINLIFDLKNKGFSNVKIAEYMGVSEGTIRNRLKTINKKVSQ